MPRSIEALVEPELLVWARKSIGLPSLDAAKKIGITEEKLFLWESGDTKPSIAQLRKCANVYKRPLAVFFLPKPPNKFETTFDAMRDFRRIPTDLEVTSSTGLRLEIRKARDRRQTIIELSENLNQDLVKFNETATLHDDPEKLASRIRSDLGIKLNEQKKWRESYQAFNSWKIAVENIGILVFQSGQYQGNNIETIEMRGGSISLNPFPIILINGKDAINGRIFTLLHELVHIYLNMGGISDLQDYSNPQTETQKVESFCNHVAGAILIPIDDLLENKLVIENRGNDYWADEQLKLFSRIYSVSREVVLRRLLIAGRTTEEFYSEKRKELLDEFAERKKGKASGAPPHYKRIISHHGNSYIKIVLGAYYHDIITASAVSGYLGTKLEHIPKIERDVMGFTSGLGAKL